MQAADLVAHEAYRHFVKRLKEEDVELDPHTERLFMDAFDSKGAWAGRDEIADTVRQLRSRLDIPNASGGQ